MHVAVSQLNSAVGARNTFRFGSDATSGEKPTHYTVWDNTALDYVTLPKRALDRRNEDLISHLDEVNSYRGGTTRETMERFWHTHQRPDHAYLFGQAALDVSRKDNRHGTGRPFAELLPVLLFTYPPGETMSLTSAIEATMDLHSNMRGRHPNEAEQLALLNHPGVPRPNKSIQHITDLTQSLTSPYRWLDYDDVNIYGDTVNNWRRIGRITHGFRFHRFDTQSGMKIPDRGEAKRIPSLIEQYGFEPVKGRDTDKPFDGHPGFGPGFVLVNKPETITSNIFGTVQTQPFDKQTHVEWRRGYWLISHPEDGTAIIRNSSNVFGRDGLVHPAYYSQKGLRNGYSMKQLLDLTPLEIERQFKPLLAIEPNRARYGMQAKLTRLLDHAFAVKDGYRAWKFDTGYDSAWRWNEPRPHPTPTTTPQQPQTPTTSATGAEIPVLTPLASYIRRVFRPSAAPKTSDANSTPPPSAVKSAELRGGFRSDGFKAFVEFLRRRYDEVQGARALGEKAKHPMPALAFFTHHQPPWEPVPYITRSGKTAKYLPLNESRVKALEALANGRDHERQLKRTNLRGFIQAGLDSLGELTMVERPPLSRRKSKRRKRNPKPESY